MRRSVDAALRRLERVCAEAADPRELRLALLDELRAAVGFDFYAWLLTDPQTEVGVAPIAAVPDLTALPRLIRLKYLTAVNRWTSLSQRVATLVATTEGRLDQSLVWRELLRDWHVSDVMSMVFRDAYGCWGFLDLWRAGGEDAATFTDTDIELAARALAPITTAIRRTQIGLFETAERSEPAADPVVMLLDPQLRPLAQTAATDSYLRTLVPPDAGQPPVPAAAFNAGAALLAAEQGMHEHPPWARLHLAGGRWLTVRAARVSDGSAVDAISVSITDTSASERMSLYARVCGLSPREAELLHQLGTGADTRHVARAMGVSEHTIQDHLKSIFAKTGTGSRAQLLSRATVA